MRILLKIPFTLLTICFIALNVPGQFLLTSEYSLICYELLPHSCIIRISFYMQNRIYLPFYFHHIAFRWGLTGALKCEWIQVPWNTFPLYFRQVEVMAFNLCISWRVNTLFTVWEGEWMAIISSHTTFTQLQYRVMLLVSSPPVLTEYFSC